MKPNTLLIIWAAFASSQLMVIAVGVLLWTGVDHDGLATAWTILAVGFVVGAVSLFIPQLIRGDDEGRVRTRYVMRWAFAESATFMGMVATLTGGPQWMVIAGGAWAMLLLGFAIPPR